MAADVGGWQDHSGQLHDGAPDSAADAYALRVFAPDPESGEDRWFTILEPFPDWSDLDDLIHWIDEWLSENYGEFA